MTTKQIFHAAYGEKLDVNLEDGSKVKLNSGSELVISDDFSEAERTVTLKGQALIKLESVSDTLSPTGRLKNRT